MKVPTVAVLFFAFCTLPLHAAPRLVPDAAEYEFGQTPSSTDVMHTFSLHNTGDAELKIEQVKPSCGCTVADLTKRTLAPDESVELEARLSLRGRSGKQSATITIESNDPENPTLTLRMYGEAVEPVRIQPSEMVFGQMEPGTSRQRTATVAADGDDDLLIQEVEVSHKDGAALPHDTSNSADGANPWAASLETIERGREFELTVDFTAGEAFGRSDAEIHLHTDSSAYPVLTVPVSAVVSGDLSVTPETIVISEGQEPVTRHVLIALRRDGKPVPFELESVELSGEHKIEINHRSVGQGAYQIRLSNLAADAALEGQALVIKTDLEDYPRVQVPFRIQRQNDESKNRLEQLLGG